MFAFSHDYRIMRDDVGNQITSNPRLFATKRDRNQHALAPRDDERGAMQGVAASLSRYGLDWKKIRP